MSGLRASPIRKRRHEEAPRDHADVLVRMVEDAILFRDEASYAASVNGQPLEAGDARGLEQDHVAGPRVRADVGERLVDPDPLLGERVANGRQAALPRRELSRVLGDHVRQGADAIGEHSRPDDEILPMHDRPQEGNSGTLASALEDRPYRKTNLGLMIRDVDVHLLFQTQRFAGRNCRLHQGVFAAVSRVGGDLEGAVSTFADFDRRTNQVANALLGMGLSKGQRIAYVGKNSLHYFELLFGAAKMGAVTTPIGWRCSPRCRN